MKRYDVVGFGALNVDRLGVVAKVAVDGEALVEKEAIVAGGSAANTIAGLGRLGVSTGFIGCLGNDQEANVLLEAFRKDHVDISLIEKKEGGSGLVVGLVDRQGHRSLSIFPGVNNELIQKDLPGGKELNTTFLHLSSFVSEKQLDVQIAFVSKLDPKVRVSLAPGMIYSRLGIKRLRKLLECCEIVFLTKEELEVLTDQKELNGVKILQDIGVEIVVVTDGANGVYVAKAGNLIHVPAFPTAVVDTTGAGDAFIAGFLYGVLHGFSIHNVAVAGNLLAKFCVNAMGPRAGLPDWTTFTKEFDTILARQKGKLEKKRNVLIIGSGGREHAIGWKLSQSSLVEKLYFAPGNAGTQTLGKNVNIAVGDGPSLVVFAKEKRIDCTVVGPEASLVSGVVDQFTKAGLRIFGPSKAAARLETSKAWAVSFMQRHGLPHPISEVFDKPNDALDYLKKLGGRFVVKADGLCQGKGVFVCDTLEEGQAAIDSLMKKKLFGSSGETLVIQEKLDGKEVSSLAFCDGSVAIPLVSAHDYKRAYDSDRGPNTGSMGSVAPTDRVGPILSKKIHRLLTLTVEAMAEEGIPYQGILYAGVMVVAGEPYILEFNCRFGDPETQAQLPLLESDLLPILEASIDGTLTDDLVKWKDQSSVCVVLTSYGYPGSYQTGMTIQGLEKPLSNGFMVFHAGTKLDQGRFVTSGGRVLGVTSVGSTANAAREAVYGVIGTTISFESMQFRKDIGA